MSWFTHDPDEWETVPGKCETLGTYPGTNVPFGMMIGPSLRRRDPEEVKRIKAKREREREDAVLAEADIIRARRAGD